MKCKASRRLWLKFWLAFDRTLSQDSIRQILILVGVLALAFCASFMLLTLFGGNWMEICKEKGINKLAFPLYLLIDGNTFSSIWNWNEKAPVPNSNAVLIACIIYVIGVVIFTGMLIAVISNMVERRVEDYKEGRIKYRAKGHYVIMGYDDMVSSFVNHIFDNDEDAYIFILSSTKATSIRENLSRLFNKKQMKRIIINYGFRTSMEAFKKIRLEAAKQVYIVGNHSNPAHDAINVECMDSIYNYLSQKTINKRPERIICTFKDLDTYAAFKTSEIFRKIGMLGIDFMPYNFFAGWAKQVFVKRCYHDMERPDHKHPYPAVYGQGITPDDPKYVHLVFVGTTNFAVAFAMEAAHVLHFPNADKARTRITFIDKNADKEKDEFITRNRHFFEVQPYVYKDLTRDKDKEQQGIRTEYLAFGGDDANFLDVEFEFIKGDVFSKAVQDEMEGWAQEHNSQQYLSIFLAMADQRQNFVMAMNMPDKVYDNGVPVFVRQDRSDNFVTNLRQTDTRAEGCKLTHATVDAQGTLKEKERDARYANVYPFGMNETGYSADDHSLQRAKLINYLYVTADYDAFKFQDLHTLKAIPADDIKKEADRLWQDGKLTVALKWSNLYNAYAIRTKLATLRAMRGRGLNDTSLDYTPLSENNEVEAIAKVEHNRWNVEKLLMGFRKPRSEEDKYAHPQLADKLQANKQLFIHHDIRPFEQLKGISELDREFSRYIPWIMEMTEQGVQQENRKS